MSEFTIKTNNTPRLIMSWDDLTAIEQSELGYMDDDSGSYFRYRGEAYCLSDFTIINSNGGGDDLEGWDGINAQSAFSAILIKIANDCEEVVVGYYYC